MIATMGHADARCASPVLVDGGKSDNRRRIVHVVVDAVDASESQEHAREKRDQVERLQLRFDPQQPEASANLVAAKIASLTIDGKDGGAADVHLHLGSSLIAAASYGGSSRPRSPSSFSFHETILAAVGKHVSVARRRQCTRRSAEKGRSERFGRVHFFGLRNRRVAASVVELTNSAAFASEIQNVPSNLTSPESLAKEISKAFKVLASGPPPHRRPVKVTILTRRQLQEEGLGLVLGVGGGSTNDPCMVLLELGQGRSRRRRTQKSLPTIALVGKGVLYDSGGMALKPLRYMYGMHGDKTGAAIAAAVVRYFAMMMEDHEDGFNLVAALPLVENLLSDKAVRPGDVLTACDGHTVEVVNPDAEGRLIVADAIAYLCKRSKRKIDAVVDFATLTEFSRYVHPSLAAVSWCEDGELAADIELYAGRLGERVWRLPPWPFHEHQIESQIADVRNSGWALDSDAYLAALFIRRFLPPDFDPKNWVHFDVEMTGGGGASSGYHSPMNGSGVALGIAAVSAIAERLRFSGRSRAPL